MLPMCVWGSPLRKDLDDPSCPLQAAAAAALQFNNKVNKMLGVNGTSSGAVTPNPGDIAMENLYPALLECFAVILCGYLAGRCNLISQTEAKGLNTFVGTFALPSLIFLSLAELDLSAVNWTFLLAILVAKSVVFVGVGIVTLLVSRPINLGRAGLFSIFCTQSNDFAIGYPIVAALYAKTHPDYPSYMYLAAPISLVILNPLGFTLMELGRQNDELQAVRRRRGLQLAASVFRNIALNPVVFMTALGVFGNLVLYHHLPTPIAGVLKILGSAFSATALFLLGLRMVGKVHKLQGAALLVPGIIIAVKLVAMPLVTREVVSVLKPGINDSENLDLSTFGFLYGTFPSAPGVFVFATQYNIDVDLIASAMVACTFISAPLMFISARMVSLSKLDPAEYLPELDSFVFNISIAGTVICAWLLVVFILSKKYKRLPHRFTFCLVISQLLACLGAILWTVFGQDGPTWHSYLQFSIFALGVYGCRLWTAFIAIALLFLQRRSLCFVLKLQFGFYAVGWGLPLVIVLVLLLVVKKEVIVAGGRDPNFEFGQIQAFIAVFLLVMCFIVTMGCLILHQRHRQRYARYLLLVQDISSGNIQEAPLTSEDEAPDDVRTRSRPPDVCSLQGSVCEDRPINQTCSGAGPDGGCCSRIVDIEDISVRRMSKGTLSDRGTAVNNSQPRRSLGAGDLCSGEFCCDSAEREQCRSLVEQYRAQVTMTTEEEGEALAGTSGCCREDSDQQPEDEAQTFRHVVLLLFLLCSMFVGIALCIWTLVMEETMSGIFVELSFLDASLNFGQSMFVFACFGLDPQLIVLPFIRRWRRFWYGSEVLHLPQVENLTLETVQVCDQFRTHHLENCRKAIAKNRRWRLRQLPSSFRGCELVDWLIAVGLSADRVDAVKYGRHLLEGRLLRHVVNQRHFHDTPYFYTFAPVPSRAGNDNHLD